MSLAMPDRYDALASRVSRRRFLRGAAAAGTLAALGGPTLLRRAARADSTPALAPHLQLGADPATTMAVSWHTPTAVDGAALRFRPAGGDAWSAPIAAEDRIVQALGADASPTEYHHVALDGLQPGATYEYLLGEPGSGAPDGTFTTAPASGAFAFTAFGDQGVDGRTTGTKPSTMTAAIGAESAAFHLHVGDLCYANRTGMGHDDRIPDSLNTHVVDPAIWDTWLTDVSRVAANRPWMPTVGNHEMEPGYGIRGYESMVKRFMLPGNGAVVPGEPVVTYAFDYANVRVLALDANDANYEIPANHGYLDAAQDGWLEQQLASARAAGSGIDWIVVGYHQCSYCTNLLHASDQGMRDRWDALFRQYEVDLVVNGHNHSYERAHPGLAEQLGPLDVIHPTDVNPATDGPTFLTAGSGGNPRVELSAAPLSYVTQAGGLRVPEPAPWSVVRYLDLSYVRVDVDPEQSTLTVTAKKPDGSTIDRVMLHR